ncbi:MAG: YbjN domain-containing protein [Sphingomonadales bacterium]|jgi:hypothetical protein
MSVLDDVKESLEKLYFEYKVDEDGDIYVTSGLEMPFWISVTSDEKYVRIFTYVVVSEDAAEDGLNQLSNDINATYMPNSVYHKDRRLWSSYYLPVIEGFQERTFVEVIRKCISGFTSGVRTLDENDLIS